MRLVREATVPGPAPWTELRADAFRRRAVILDAVGIGLMAAGALWTYLARPPGTGPPEAMTMFLALGIGYVAARLLGPASRWAVPSAVLVLAAFLFISNEDLLSHSPLDGPFGYANATGSFFVQVAAAALMLALAAPRITLRRLALVAALGATLVPVIVESLAPGILLLAVHTTVIAAITGPARGLVIAWAGLLLAAILVSGVLGIRYGDGDPSDRLGRVAEATLTERRLVLWGEALEMIGDHPIRGVGSGRFPDVSRTAQSDSDAAWAQSEFLQQGAETGIPGLVLLVAVFVWGFVRLAMGPSAGPLVALAAASFAALGIHASIDYVLRFPAIPIAAAALVGAAVTWTDDELDRAGS